MAGAGDAHGTTVPPVLCRAVGAFRHYVDDIPVWGPAAAALTIPGDGGLDRVALHLAEVKAYKSGIVALCYEVRTPYVETGNTT